MASWTNIAAALTNPFAPGTASLFKALEENPRAIAAGAAGAPRIQHPALGVNSVQTVNVANGTLTEPKYATGSISNRALGDGQISRLKLEASTIGDFDRVVGRDAVTTEASFQTIFDVSVIRGGAFRLVYSHSSGSDTGAAVETRVLLNGVNVSTINSASNAFVFRIVDLTSVPDASTIQVQHRRATGLSQPVVTAGVRLRNAGQVAWVAPILGVARVL